ncbi:hypothetical protein CQW23_19076 [Capsicum baccatum]|uniref:Receptor-like protein 12 n=1 Tax=Capsicum baccatum TaxID=33114 RepID=A0A2G2W4R4_CAPBA|nr:hypothetical protein CQW23_19076 [Capsicum baccatum]
MHSKGKQFDTFENSSYQGNDGLRGFPLSKDCGGNDGVPQATTLVELDDEEEEEDLISWQAVLMGFGCGNNELNDTFPSWLGGLTDSKILSLRSNKLHGPISDSRTDNLFAKIRVIDFSSNGFSGNLPVSLFENFQALKKIGENSGTREYIAGDYSGNYANILIVTTKGLDQELPRVLTTYMIIDLSRNRFEGHIASIIGDLVELCMLNLSHNGLEGIIPPSLHQLSIHESLDLSSNKIGGEIPQQLASLTFLAVLNLSHNHLVGCIPKGNQFDTFENSSYQGNDGLRGLPLSKDCGGDDGVPQPTTPVELDDDKEEEGDLISWQAVLMGFSCGLVIGLSIIYIMLSTHYPDLSLGSNKLHSPIKDSRTNNSFAQIRVIDLSSNGFSGDLPVSLFENFQAMKIIGENSGTREYIADYYSVYYTNTLIVTTKGWDREFFHFLTTNIIINFSRNIFEGYVSSIIGDLVGLHALNLSHNGLEGVIPTSLQRLSVLESLDLSSNKIGCEIPQQLASLTFLAVLNLSQNHLVGCITKGKQFNTFENSSYQWNDGLRGLPLSKDCGGDDGVPQAETPVELDDEEEEGDLISWQEILMGFGCGLVIGLSIIYIMLSTHYPVWFSRMVDSSLICRR